MKRISGLLLVLALFLTPAFGQTPAAQDKWRFSLGAGFSSLALDGDLGFHTPAGAVTLDVDLDNSDTQDMFKSAFGLAGSAAKGKWQILFVGGRLTLEDDTDNATATWDRDVFEVDGVYRFAVTGKNMWGALFGARHTAHSWELDAGNQGDFDLDESWTDAVIGITHTLPFAKKWAWSSRVDGAFGGSDGSFLISTGINWRVATWFALSFNVKKMSIDYEKGEKGDSDWYLYDIDETSGGIGFAFLW